MTTPSPPRPLWQEMATLTAAVLAVVFACATGWALIEPALRPWLTVFFRSASVTLIAAMVLGIWGHFRRQLIEQSAAWKQSPDHLRMVARPHRLNRIGGWGGLALAGLLWILLPLGVMVRDASARMAAENSLHNIAVALHNYADAHDGELPPPAVVNERGERLLSWRVLLLPYLEHDSLYKQFRLDEPWDSPHNFALLPRMPSVYASHDRYLVPPGHTRYQALVGPGTAFDGQAIRLKPKDFPDGLKNTLLVAEAEDAVPWTKPDDLVFHPTTTLPPFRQTGDGWTAPTAFIGLLADGSVRPYSFRWQSEDEIRSLITRDGGEDVSQFK